MMEDLSNWELLVVVEGKWCSEVVPNFVQVVDGGRVGLSHLKLEVVDDVEAV